jgi:catechol 2,3-dioxygenase-like lactoylglutathione lyase family enzyme
MNGKLVPGKNIAMKVPVHEFDSTVVFYRDILGFEEIDASSPDEVESVTFKFGDKNLWIDKIEGLSQAEIWLEVVTKDIEKASKYLEENHCIRRDEIEPLPEGFKGFWLANPANIIHLVNEDTA